AAAAPGARGQRAVSAARTMTRRRQAGFALVAAVFILVALALLGAYMVTIGGVQRTTVAQALQAARAYQAARAGIEWGTRRVVADSACPAGPTVIALADPVLNGFQVSVSCASGPTRYRDGDRCFNVFHLQAYARYGAIGDPYFVSRQIDVQVTDAPITQPPGL